MLESKARAALAETFLAALKDDTIPWRKCWNARPVSFSTGKPYRGINNLMLSFVADEQGYQDTRWMTYKQAQEHGWQVRKGEKSVRVEYWHYYDTKLKKTLDRDEIVRIQREDPDRMQDIRLAAYTYNVFNVEQIDGDIPRQKNAAIQDPAKLKALRDEFLANLGVRFWEGGDRSFYLPRVDTINMPRASSFESDSGYVCTLLHEAGHATGHPSRLNRQLKNEFGSPDYAREELRAEIASAFTAQALKLPYQEGMSEDLIQNHKAYIQDWIAVLENDPNELFAAIKDADKITDYLLERGKLLELTRSDALESNFSFEYQLLDRLRSDCEYFLNAGGRHEKHLWAGSVSGQIAKMRELYDLLTVKPDWLSREDINEYEERMTGPISSSQEDETWVKGEAEEDYEPEL